MRNMKKGGPSSEESDNAEMRDDKIAEDYGAEESGSEIEDDKKNLEESSDDPRQRLSARSGRRRRLVN
jgi:hypothetical protein